MFAETELPKSLQETLIRHTQQDRLISQITRDPTAVGARERFAKQLQHKSIPKRKPCRQRKAEWALLG